MNIQFKVILLLTLLIPMSIFTSYANEEFAFCCYVDDSVRVVVDQGACSGEILSAVSQSTFDVSINGVDSMCTNAVIRRGANCQLTTGEFDSSRFYLNLGDSINSNFAPQRATCERFESCGPENCAWFGDNRNIQIISQEDEIEIEPLHEGLTPVDNSALEEISSTSNQGNIQNDLERVFITPEGNIIDAQGNPIPSLHQIQEQRFLTPPICMGENRALGWDGQRWICNIITVEGFQIYNNRSFMNQQESIEQSITQSTQEYIIEEDSTTPLSVDQASGVYHDHTTNQANSASLYATRMAVGLEEEDLRFDVTQNGRITTIDALQILRVSTNLEVADEEVFRRSMNAIAIWELEQNPNFTISNQHPISQDMFSMIDQDLEYAVHYDILATGEVTHADVYQMLRVEMELPTHPSISQETILEVVQHWVERVSSDLQPIVITAFQMVVGEVEQQELFDVTNSGSVELADFFEILRYSWDLELHDPHSRQNNVGQLFHWWENYRMQQNQGVISQVVLRMAVGLEEEDIRFDVTQTSQVTSSDALEFLRYERNLPLERARENLVSRTALIALREYVSFNQTPVARYMQDMIDQIEPTSLRFDITRSNSITARDVIEMYKYEMTQEASTPEFTNRAQIAVKLYNDHFRTSALRTQATQIAPMVLRRSVGLDSPVQENDLHFDITQSGRLTTSDALEILRFSTGQLQDIQTQRRVADAITTHLQRNEVEIDCFDRANVGEVGNSEPCQGMLIVDTQMLKSVASSSVRGDESFSITGPDGLEYTFENSNRNIFTGQVTDFSSLFRGTDFNGNINYWDTRNVISMAHTFRDSSFNQPINNWNTSNVRSIPGMFDGATNFNQDIGSWDVSQVQDMRLVFNRAQNFNQDIGSWDVSNVRTMGSMFSGASSFNQPLSNWDVSSATNMNAMFLRAASFNQDISNWDVEGVTSMSSMFNLASSFNQDISNWDVSSVTNMNSMFLGAASFNQPLSNWDVRNVANMNNMFLRASSYDQDLRLWDVEHITTRPMNFGVDSQKEPFWGLRADSHQLRISRLNARRAK